MARTVMKLSGAQELALTEVRESRAKLERAKLELEAELRKKMQDELAQLEMGQAVAVRRAVDLGVPKRRVMAEGLGLKNAHAVYAILRLTERLATSGDDVQAGFSWHDKAAGLVRVRVDHFPTRSTAPDYPETLDGIVNVAVEPWEVVQDASDQETELGVIPGFLRWELDDENSHVGDDGALATMLAKWLAENAA